MDILEKFFYLVMVFEFYIYNQSTPFINSIGDMENPCVSLEV